MADSQEEIRQVAIEHHHDWAGNFETWYADLEDSRFASAFTYGRAKLDKMVDELFRSLRKGGKVLDVGCGTGEHLKRAIGLGLDACGLEPAPGMLEAARRNVPQATLKKGVATKLPFADGEFDAVIMIEVLRYLHRRDVELALEEARRVLRPGGKLLVTLVNRWALDGFYILYRMRQLLNFRAYHKSHPYCLFFTPAEAKRQLEKAGLTDVRTAGRLFGPVRVAYKLHERFGQKVAAAIEQADESFHRQKWTRPFAGHLIAIGEAPGQPEQDLSRKKSAGR